VISLFFSFCQFLFPYLFSCFQGVKLPKAKPTKEIQAAVVAEPQEEITTTTTEPTEEPVIVTPTPTPTVVLQQQVAPIPEIVTKKEGEPMAEQMDVDLRLQLAENESKPAVEEQDQKNGDDTDQKLEVVVTEEIAQPAQKVSEYSAAAGEVLEKEKAYVVGRLTQLRILFDTSFDLLLQLRSEGAAET